MKAYKQRKEAEAKLWQTQANTSAWLCGIYVMRAIGNCISSDVNYPQSPLRNLFKSDPELPDQQEDTEREKAKGDQDLITAQILHAKSVLKKQDEK